MKWDYKDGIMACGNSQWYLSSGLFAYHKKIGIHSSGNHGHLPIRIVRCTVLCSEFTSNNLLSTYSNPRIDCSRLYLDLPFLSSLGLLYQLSHVPQTHNRATQISPQHLPRCRYKIDRALERAMCWPCFDGFHNPNRGRLTNLEQYPHAQHELATSARLRRELATESFEVRSVLRKQTSAKNRNPSLV